MQLILTSIIRHLLSAFGGVLAIEGLATDSNAQVIVSALMILVAPVWSFIEKKYLTKK